MANSTQPSTITIPRTVSAASKQLTELGGIVTATEWHRAAIVAAFVEPGTAGRPRNPSIPTDFESATVFAQRGIVGLSSHGTVLIYANAWLDRFPRPKPGTRVQLPDDSWPPTTFEDDRTSAVTDRDAIVAQAVVEGTGAAKALDVAKNTRAMTAAIKGSPKVAEAAAQALIETGDVPRLSKATGKAAMNRQVERNRKRVAEGLGKGRTVQDKPTLGDPMLAAFLKTDGLTVALKALVTTFPAEWAALSDEVRADEDYVGVCEEMCDRIDIAVANIRTMIAGGISDAELQNLLSGGEA